MKRVGGKRNYPESWLCYIYRLKHLVTAPGLAIRLSKPFIFSSVSQPSESFNSNITGSFTTFLEPLKFHPTTQHAIHSSTYCRVCLQLVCGCGTYCISPISGGFATRKERHNRAACSQGHRPRIYQSRLREERCTQFS